MLVLHFDTMFLVDGVIIYSECGSGKLWLITDIRSAQILQILSRGKNDAIPFVALRYMRLL